MAVKYCGQPGCGGKSEYAGGVEPRFCGVCGVPFAQAFATQQLRAPTPKAPIAAPRAPAPRAPFAPRNALLQRAPDQRPIHEVYDSQIDDDGSGETDDEEPYVDEREVRARTRELARQLHASDFVINAACNTVRFGDVVKIQPDNAG